MRVLASMLVLDGVYWQACWCLMVCIGKHAGAWWCESASMLVLDGAPAQAPLLARPHQPTPHRVLQGCQLAHAGAAQGSQRQLGACPCS